MAIRKPVIDTLFVAVPELAFNFSFVDSLYASGLIDNEDMARIIRARKAAKRADKIAAAAMRDETLVRRLLAVAPEIVNVELVDLLAGITYNEDRVKIQPGVAPEDRRHYTKRKPLIKAKNAHALRLAIRSLNAATRGGLPTDRSQIFSRLMRVVGVNVSSERIDMWRAMGIISKKDAERWRGYLSAGIAIKESIAKARRAKSLLDALLLLGETPVTRELIEGLVQSGLLSAKLGGAYISAIELGTKQWRVIEGAKAGEGYRQRLALILTGSMNRELLQFLVSIGVINKKTRSRLLIAEVIARQINDELLESMVKRRYRIKPGEPPIKTFAKATRADDAAILRLLADSANEASREAKKLAEKPGIGAKTRSRQYSLEARALHEAMRKMWEGVGYMTIFGESNVAEAAAEAAIAMQRGILEHMPPGIEDSLLWQAKAGVDNYISRQENTLALSSRVYKNMSLWEGKVDNRINMSLLQGKSASEIANDVKRYISPRVPGGVSYAAMRLARTEIQNAFHWSTVRFTREQPWVKGYLWNLSGSHPHRDVCNDMADEDHDNLGRGVYKKSNVPGKPHPHCFCYITVVMMDENEFLNAYKKGRMSSYMRQIAQGKAYGASTTALPTTAARVAGSYAGNIAMDMLMENTDRFV